MGKSDNPEKPIQITELQPEHVAHIKAGFQFSWEMFAIGEAQAAVRDAEKVFTADGLSDAEIQETIFSWTRIADDITVLLILRRSLRLIGQGKSCEYSAGDIRAIAACFIRLCSSDLARQGMSNKVIGFKDAVIEGRLGALTLPKLTVAAIGTRPFFLLLRFSDLLRQAGEVANDSGGKRNVEPSPEVIAQIQREARSNASKHAASHPRPNRKQDSGGGRALVAAVREVSKKRVWNAAWDWLCGKADSQEIIDCFELLDRSDALVRYKAGGKVRCMTKGTFSKYWNSPTK